MRRCTLALIVALLGVWHPIRHHSLGQITVSIYNAMLFSTVQRPSAGVPVLEQPHSSGCGTQLPLWPPAFYVGPGATKSMTGSPPYGCTIWVVINPALSYYDCSLAVTLGPSGYYDVSWAYQGVFTQCSYNQYGDVVNVTYKFTGPR